MKIGLDAGHCLRGSDTGAQGCGYREEILTRNITNQVSRRLQSAGHKVVICNCETANSLRESLNYRTNKANTNNVDLFISIHINAGGGVGTEVYTYNAKRLDMAERAVNNISKLGFRNRGIKDGKHLAVIRNSHAPAMLVECCFIDSPSDMARYKQLGATAFGDAIADAILNVSRETPAKKPPVSKPTNTWQNLEGKVGVCTGNGVRVRSSKSTANTSNVIGSLNKGDRVNLYRREGDWVHVFFPPHGGYVYGKYINY